MTDDQKQALKDIALLFGIVTFICIALGADLIFFWILAALEG